MIETPEQLAQHVQRHLVPADAITNMTVHRKLNFVSFHWCQRDFVVKRSLEVFEVKGQNLFLTGASLLMQSTLRGSEAQGRAAQALVTSLRQAEDLIADDQQRDSGLRLLTDIKDMLGRLARSPELMNPPPSASAPGSSAHGTNLNPLRRAEAAAGV